MARRTRDEQQSRQAQEVTLLRTVSKQKTDDLKEDTKEFESPMSAEEAAAAEKERGRVAKRKQSFSKGLPLPSRRLTA